MNSKDAAVEVALLEIAKDLLQASDDLAATDPSASAKLAHEAYEIGRDLGIVRDHLDAPSAGTPVASALNTRTNGATNGTMNGRINGVANGTTNGAAADAAFGHATSTYPHQHAKTSDNELVVRRSGAHVYEEEGDDELFRILDRQRAVVPSLPELAPARKPSRRTEKMQFETATPRRSGWFSWMRSRDLHPAR